MTEFCIVASLLLSLRLIETFASFIDKFCMKFTWLHIYYLFVLLCSAFENAENDEKKRTMRALMATIFARFISYLFFAFLFTHFTFFFINLPFFFILSLPLALSRYCFAFYPHRLFSTHHRSMNLWCKWTQMTMRNILTKEKKIKTEYLFHANW